MYILTGMRCDRMRDLISSQTQSKALRTVILNLGWIIDQIF